MSGDEGAGIRRAAVIGAGVMGTGIAQVLALAGVEVVCVDRSASQLRDARQLISSGRFGLDAAVASGRLTSAAADAARGLLTFGESLDAVAGAELVIEAIPEDLEAKQAVIAQLVELLGPNSVVASNTSGLSITTLASTSARPESVIGWHWSSPPQAMRLAEIVRGEHTSEGAVDRVVELARRCGKNPIIIADRPETWGFVANRVLRAAIREAKAIVADGVATAEEVDQLMVDAYRWPVGPLSVLAGAADGWGDSRGGSVSSLLEDVDGTA